MRVVRYFAVIGKPKLILWCYLAWYFAIVSCYFDPAPGLWVSSIGISGIIGFALNLATRKPNETADRWVVFRLYVFPFCVSSYSALIKGKGFILLFPTDAEAFLFGCAASLSVVGLHIACKAIDNAATRAASEPSSPA